MHSAKQLKRHYRDWQHDPVRATIFVVGWVSYPPEPLLLQALANHPGCEKLYFVPLNGEHGERNFDKFNADDIGEGPNEWRDSLEKAEKPGPIWAYDITGLLTHPPQKPRGSDEVNLLLGTYFHNTKAQPVLTSAPDLLINGSGKQLLDHYILRRNPLIAVENNSVTSHMLCHKTMLPELQRQFAQGAGMKVVANCTAITNRAEIEVFMQEHGYQQIVLKESDSNCGEGIYRVWREADGQLMVENASREYIPTDDHPRVQSLSNIAPQTPLFPTPVLAMEWLDTNKGDMRVIVQDGQCIGAYNRLPANNSWLCNQAQGGSIQPVDMRRDLSRSDRKRMQAVASKLAELGIGRAAIDFLADAEGNRYLSEINVGNTSDIMEIEAHWGERHAAFGRLPVAEQMATNILQNYRLLVQQEQLEQSFGKGRS